MNFELLSIRLAWLAVHVWAFSEWLWRASEGVASLGR